MNVLEWLVADLEEREVEPEQFGPAALEAVGWEEAVADWVSDRMLEAQDAAQDAAWFLVRGDGGAV